jgi:8-oxo-dGTP diphosphatase
MLKYYSGLAKDYGKLVARYRNAICFVMDEKHIYEAMEPNMESQKFILTDKPHSTIRKKGFPLDSISLDLRTGKYYYDLPEDKLEQVAVEDGFLEFFRNVLNLN